MVSVCFGREWIPLRRNERIFSEWRGVLWNKLECGEMRRNDGCLSGLETNGAFLDGLESNRTRWNFAERTGMLWDGVK